MNDDYINQLIRETQQLLENDEKISNNIDKKEKKKLKKIISIASGKGGVGKTTLSVNIALALAEKGINITLLDADLGLGDGDILLGNEVKYTLMDFLNGNCSFEDIISEVYGIKFITVGSGIVELANMDDISKNFVYEQISSNIDTDYLLIDTGAGISRNTTFFIERSDLCIIIATPEPTSFVDAYQTIKTMYKKGFNKIKLLINRAHSEEEAFDVFNRMDKVFFNNMGKNLDFIGFIPEDINYQYSLFRRKPYYIDKKNEGRFFIEKVVGILYNTLIQK